jgi:8-oxo-dGTP pyrophosphatase MutT (NUDIX family)
MQPSADPAPLATLTFEEVVERLVELPAQLPEGPAALIPTLLSTGERPPRAPGDAQRVRPASVLVLIYPDDAGLARVVLTERVDRGGHHSGEVSFPGGKAEPDDVDVVATALREAAEEVGLDPLDPALTIVGVLEPFWIPISGFQVTPVVALADRRPRLVPAEDEVARIVEAPVAAFLPGAQLEVVERTIRGWSIRYSAYPIEGLSVWGATARILGQLGAILDRD